MSMTRARAAAAATLLGLGALAGVAIETNHGLPAAAQHGSGSGALVTQASGAVATPSQATNQEGRPPIVTRASGGGAVPAAHTIDH